MTTLFWTTIASEDREGIFDYIEPLNLNAAITLDELFAEKAQVLVDYPELGREGRVTGTRELVINNHYVLIYDIVDDTVRVLRLLHTAMQWPPAEADQSSR